MRLLRTLSLSIAFIPVCIFCSLIMCLFLLSFVLFVFLFLLSFVVVVLFLHDCL
jgi:hypothetical protein